MSGQGGVSIVRNRNEDRFYSPPAVRKHKQQQLLLQQQKQQKKKNTSSRNHHPAAKHSEDSEKISEDCNSSESSRTDSGCSVSRQGVDCSSNFDRFLHHTTPVVPAHHFPKTTMRGCRSYGAEFHPYFMLEDLWEFFREWSAYGAGVPLLLNESDSVMQYYVPYLSGIQLYINPSRPPSGLSSRRPGDDSDAESSRETSSDGSSDRERGSPDIFNGAWDQQNLTDTSIKSFNKLSLRNKPVMTTSSGEDGIHHPPGRLIFEYLEQNPPFNREPLADKITILASRFPELRTYRSCDLLPSSWISVAWYPIYRIPTGPTLQNLDACFLTFHSLSTPFGSKSSDTQHRHSLSSREVHFADMSTKLQLPIFGLASYKFKASVWNATEGHDYQKVDSLLLAADNWLRVLQVDHPDYRFFVSHNLYQR